MENGDGMKILQTPPRILSSGGVERYVADLSGELIKRGHQVQILCSRSRSDVLPRSILPVRILTPLGLIGNTPITPSLPCHLLCEDFDILHTHTPTPWSSDWSRIIAGLKGRPLVLTYHSAITGEGSAAMIARFYNRTALKHLFRSADRIILARPGYIPLPLRNFQDRIEYIPVGVDTSQFYPEKTGFSTDVFFLSVLDAFHGFKGLDTLLEAIKRVKKEIPTIRLVIGGGGSQIPYYARQADSMDLGANVRFTGYIPQERLKDYFTGSRLFVLPSRAPELETFGIVLLEAMACGRPVVTTKIAGMAEDIIRSSSGIIVEPDSPGELATAILSILKDEYAAEKMGENGLHLIREKYLWPTIAARMEQLYKDIQ